MIDVEADIFNQLAKAAISVNPNCYTTSMYVVAPAHFPCVMIVEKDNRVLSKTEDSSNEENAVSLVYEVQVFSNAEDAKEEAKAIVAEIDSAARKLNMRRVFLGNVKNASDTSIYRYVIRYRVVADKKAILYTR